MKKSLWALALCLCLTACGGGEPAPTDTPAPSPSPTAAQESRTTSTPAPDPVGERIAAMTVEEKVGQLLVVGVEGTRAGEDARTAIQEYKVGGVILFDRNVETAAQLAALTNELKELNRGSVPLFLCVDEEGGTVSRMPGEVKDLPDAYDFGTIPEEEGRLETCRALGEILAGCCEEFGFQVNFAPVMDVWSNPDNRVIGQRAYGTDPETVAQAALQVARGMMEEEVIPVVKHFPGHGDTAEDSHETLPVVDKTLEELEELELGPFRRAVEGGVPAVMVGHILARSVDPDHPASLSPIVVNGLLRAELGFDGVVFTDDLTMGAITGDYDLGEAAVLAVQAGCDQVLVCHGQEMVEQARWALLDAVQSGRISGQRLEESLRRVLSLKGEYELSNEPVDAPDVDELNRDIQAFLE